MTAAENKRADNSRPKATGYRLCVYASGSLITVVFISFTWTNVSFLHLGQNSGKCSSTVFRHTLVWVLLLQRGHSTHFSISNAPPPFHGYFFRLFISRLQRIGIDLFCHQKPNRTDLIENIKPLAVARPDGA